MKGFMTALAVVVAVMALLVGLNYSGYLYEIPSRLAGFHNIVNISVEADNEAFDMNNTEILLEDETGNITEVRQIINGEAKFKKGIYGINKFSISIPHESIDDIWVEFGQFNTNRWHICEYDVNVNVVTVSEEAAEITLKADITVEGNRKSYEKTRVLTKDDSIISIEGFY